MSKLLERKILGCMTAAAAGDAFGSPFEALHHKTIARISPSQTAPNFRFSDDTLLRLATYSAIVKKGGRIDARDMADAWKEHVSPLMKEFWVPELFVAIELGMGSSPREIGSRNIRGDGAAMSIDPIGVINSCNPRNAAMDARDVAGLSQAGEQVEAAMSVASAVAKAFEVEAQPDEVVAAAKEFGGPVMTKKIEEAMKIASSSGSIQRKYQKLYDEVAIEDGTSGYVRRWREGNIAKYRAADISMGISPVEVVAVAIAFFHYTNGRVMETINCCARYGRDADSIAGIAGSIAGALKGGETLEKGLVEKIDAANSTSLEDLATKVGAVVRRTITEEEAKLEEGRSLLDTL